jgi:hypothetical protein
MQSGSWTALLQQIPKTQHGNLVFTTAAGLEIAAQSIVRIDSDYVLVRGRQTGVTDGGSFFFIPYERILFVGFQKEVKESVLRAMYGDAVEAEPTTEALSESSPGDETAPMADPALEATPAAVPPVVVTPVPAPEAPKPPIANKAALLERLRARRNDPTGETV